MATIIDRPCTSAKCFANMPSVLPIDLIISIARYLYDPVTASLRRPFTANYTDLFNLRLAGNRKLADAGLEVIQRVTQTICIEHSTASVARFRAICNSPSHARYIREIRYHSALRSVPSDELRQDPRFNTVVDKHNVPQDVVSTVIAEYEEQKLDQERVCAADEVFGALVNGLKLLPNLRWITINDIPVRKVQHRISDTIIDCGGVPAAYNCLRIWDAMSGQPECAEDMLRCVARYSTHPTRNEGLQPLIRAMAAVSDSAQLKDIVLRFLCTTHILDESWECFAQRHVDTIELALRSVASINLFIGSRAAYGQDGQVVSYKVIDTSDMVRYPRWVSLLEHATTLERLSLEGWEADYDTLLQSIITSTSLTLPHLKSLIILSSTHWLWKYHFNSQPRYNTRQLSNFLQRHRLSLERLLLGEAAGSGSLTPGVPSAEEFGSCLAPIKDEMPKLKTAYICEVQRVFDNAENDPHDRNATDSDHGSEYQIARAFERSSPLGKLAQRCSIKPEVWVPDDSDIGRQAYVHDFIRSPAPRSLIFDYDFGPFVLGKANEETSSTFTYEGWRGMLGRRLGHR